MKKFQPSRCILLAASGVAAVSILSTACGVAAPSSDTILFTATINTEQVTHKLFQPGDKNVPHPFYKGQCARTKSSDYGNASGQAVFWYNKKTNILKYAITYQGLSGSPIMAHFHIAASGQSGPIVQTICGMPPKNSKALGYSARALDGSVCPKGKSGFFQGTYRLAGNRELKLTTQAEIKALLAGKLYINFHTCLNELGEARGQIVPYHQND